MYLKIPALVIRVTNYNERDSLLTLMTGKYGKITAKARGLRRKNSPLVAPCQLLAYSEFTLFEYRGMYTVNEADTIELFSDLRKDLVKLSLGSYFAQVAELLSQEDTPNPDLLGIVLNSLYALTKLRCPNEQIKAVFELRAACLSGYTPDLSGCHICGNEQSVMLDLSGGLVLCDHCKGAATGIRLPISASVLNAMRYVIGCDSKKIFSFSMGAESLLQLSAVTEAYLTTQLERGFSTLDFYKSLLI